MAAVIKFSSKTMPVKPDRRFSRNRQAKPHPVFNRSLKISYMGVMRTLMTRKINKTGTVSAMLTCIEASFEKKQKYRYIPAEPGQTSLGQQMKRLLRPLK